MSRYFSNESILMFLRFTIWCLPRAMCYALLLCAMLFSNENLFAQVPKFKPATEIHVRGNSPTVSPDGLEIYFGYNLDIYRDVRESTNEPWTFDPAEFIESLSFGEKDRSPEFSSDGLSMVLSHDSKIYEARRRTVNDEWTEFSTLGIYDSRGIEIRGIDPSMTEDKLTLFYTSNFFSFNNAQIRAIKRESTDDMFVGPGNLLNENINIKGRPDRSPHISDDGLTLYFVSDREGGYGRDDIWVARRDAIDDEFGEPMVLGPEINSPESERTPFVALDGTMYFSRAFNENRCCSRLFQANPIILGDFDDDGVLSAVDIDLLTEAISDPLPDPKFDLNTDGKLDSADHSAWVKEVRATWFGDANLDGEFNSTDLVIVFEAGQFEDDVDDNSGWAEGDWNADGDFTTSDLVAAFQDGGYEQGPRIFVSAVPEPTSYAMLLTILIGFTSYRRFMKLKVENIQA